jgi:hypothetical protein
MENDYQNSSWGKGLIKSRNNESYISHLIFVLVPKCGEYEICNQKIILRSISRQRPFFIDRFNLIQNKVGYRSCFATGVKLKYIC